MVQLCWSAQNASPTCGLKGHVEVVRVLSYAGLGLSLNYVQKSLRIAVDAGNYDLVECFLQAGVDPGVLVHGPDSDSVKQYIKYFSLEVEYSNNKIKLINGKALSKLKFDPY